MIKYINENEQIKATEVRKLVKELNELRQELLEVDEDREQLLIKEIKNKRDNADKLSLELADYLKINYPDNFCVHRKIIPREYEDYLFDYFRIGKKNGKIVEIIEEYRKSLDNYDIMLLHNEKRDYIIFNNNEIPLLTYSNDKRKMKMSEKFYDFMEEMGLTLKAVNFLYFEDRKKIYNPEIKIWPLNVKDVKKLA